MITRRMALVCGAAVWLFLVAEGLTAAMRGGGGGARGGGIRSSPSISGRSSRGSGTSMPAYQRPTAPVPSPAVNRPTPPSPTVRPSVSPTGGTLPQRPSGGEMPARNSGSVIYDRSGGAYPRPSQPSVGDYRHIDGPRGGEAVIGRGPDGGGGVVIKGPDGGGGAVIKGPDGGGGAVIKGPDGGGGAVIKGPGGGGAAVIRGPGGGGGAAIKGPDGGGAAVIKGPGGGGAAVIKGPDGGGAAIARGPGGVVAGGIRGPEGYYVAGIRGPHGGQVFTNIPPGAIVIGGGFWRHGYWWYHAYWHDDDWYYEWVYPRIGFWYATLPPSCTIIVIEGDTYYVGDGVYYKEGEEDGKRGYVVAEVPKGAAPDPYEVLKRACDFLGRLERLTVAAYVTTEEVFDADTKVSVSSERQLTVERPDKFAGDMVGDAGSRLVVCDGKTLTLLDRNRSIYTDFPVSGAIEDVLDRMAKERGTTFPLLELAHRQVYDRLVARTTSGRYLGLHKVGDVPCHHLAFAQENQDCEVWIEAGERPFIRKVVVIHREAPQRPRFTALLDSWATPASLPQETFRFQPPPDAAKVAADSLAGKG